MPRLSNERTGVVVNVDDAAAATLHADGDTWTDAPSDTDTKAPAKKTTAKKAASSNTEK